MLFSSSSPPKGKVCREKWRGSPIWQMLFLFSNLHWQEVWKTFWYHHGCGWTYMEWNKSQWLVWHSIKIQAVKWRFDFSLKRGLQLGICILWLKPYYQSLYDSRLCAPTPWSAADNDRADRMPPHSDEREGDVVQYIRLHWKQFLHLSPWTYTLMLLKK